MGVLSDEVAYFKCTNGLLFTIVLLFSKLPTEELIFCRFAFFYW